MLSRSQSKDGCYAKRHCYHYQCFIAVVIVNVMIVDIDTSIDIDKYIINDIYIVVNTVSYRLSIIIITS